MFLPLLLLLFSLTLLQQQQGTVVAAQDDSVQCQTCLGLWERISKAKNTRKCKNTCKKQQDKGKFEMDPVCQKSSCCKTLCTSDNALGGCQDTDYCSTPTSPEVAWINEFHYDNQGVDQDEFLEIAYTSGTDITSYKIVLYNGATGAVYNTIDIPDGASAGNSNINLSVVSGITIQNGPDGMALVDGSNNVVEFLSYEGTFTATDGPAEGTISEDIGKSESASSATGLSLQRYGDGCKGSDFDWWDPDTATPGALYDPWMNILGCEAAPTAPTPTPPPAPPSPTPPLSNTDVKVMTYNIYLGGTTDDRWKDIVKDENADILVFTEVGNWWENNDRLLNQYLAEFNTHFSGETPYVGSTVQGYDFPNTANAIMTRFPIVQEWQLTDAELSSSSAHDVMAWKLDVGSSNNKFVYVFGIHLKCCGGNTEDERRNNTMRYLLDWIDQNTNPQDGVMLMGDFNSVSPVDTDPSFPGYQSGFEPSSGSNLNDGPMRMLLDDSEQYSSTVHTFRDAFRAANPVCGSNANCCADTLCDPGLSASCPERGYTYVYDTHNVDSRIDFIVVNQAIAVTGPATAGNLGGYEVCNASDHLPVDAIVGF